MNLELGPYHGQLPAPIKLKLTVSGNLVESAEYETGYCYRGVEKSLLKQNWFTGPLYAARVDPEGAVFGELAFVLALEELLAVSVPDRAQQVRLVLCELARVQCHLAFFARLARTVNSTSMFHYCLRDREVVLDLFELVTGSRYGMGLVCVGGLSQDVTEGFLERVQQFCEVMRFRMREYRDIFIEHHVLSQRLQAVASVTKVRALEMGVTGPNARACGDDRDLRKDRPYSGYTLLANHAIGGDWSSGFSDAYQRLVYRGLEIEQSLELLERSSKGMKSGAFRGFSGRGAVRVPRGEAYATVESSRGVFGVYLVSDGQDHPSQIKFRVPSTFSLSLIPEILAGVELEDVPVAVASLDLCIPEVDR